MIWSPPERTLWGLAITIAIICGIYFIHLGRKREVFNERTILLGLASLPLGFAFSLLFTYIQVFQVPGIYDFDENLFCGDYNSVDSLYYIYGVLSYISFGLGGLFFVLAFDLIVKRTKFLFTIIAIIPIVLEVFSFDNPDLARSVFNFYLILELVFLVPFILYLYTKWSHFEFKAVSSFFFFSFILFMISSNLAKRAHKELNAFPLYLGPLLLITGCCIILIPIITDPKTVSRPLLYWALFAILSISSLITITSIDVIAFLKSPDKLTKRWTLFFAEYAIAITYMTILLSLIIKNIRSEMKLLSHEATKEEETYRADFLSMFTRPTQVNFLASISHELKTPLTSIIGFTTTILKGRVGDINEEQENQLNVILNSANYLNELINDVFDITRIEANKLTITKGKFDLVKELKNVKKLFDVEVKNKGLELFMENPGSLIIYNDKKRINQILINLLGNAVKFTDKGKISIKIKRKRDKVVVSVKDTGPGMKEEDLKKLFKPFSRIIEAGISKEGSGLGLHLSKKLANLLGGDISVKSKYGKGSTFKLILEIEEEGQSL
ncbi:MAG: sensor histidine kinase [Promethearchaeota archaeon]|jgi:signal transduction histidine kinase